MLPLSDLPPPSHILDCIAGGCIIHLHPSSYSFDISAAISALDSYPPSSPDHFITAKAHSVTAYSSALRFVIDRIALDASSTEMSLCFDATQLAASQDSGRALSLTFLTNLLAASGGPSSAALTAALTDADMQFLREY